MRGPLYRNYHGSPDFPGGHHLVFAEDHLGLAHWLHAVCLPAHAPQPGHRFVEVWSKLEGVNFPDDLYPRSGRVHLADERG